MISVGTKVKVRDNHDRYPGLIATVDQQTPTLRDGARWYGVSWRDGACPMYMYFHPDDLNALT